MLGNPVRVGGEERAFPRDELPVVGGSRFPERRRGATARVVRVGHVAQDDSRRSPVEDEVVRDDDQAVAVGAVREQGNADERAAYVERSLRDRAGELGQRGGVRHMLLGEDLVEQIGPVGMHDLARAARVVGRVVECNPHAQLLVAAEHRCARRLHRAAIERTRDVHCERDVVARVVRIEVREQQQRLLGNRQREGFRHVGVEAAAKTRPKTSPPCPSQP